MEFSDIFGDFFNKSNGLTEFDRLQANEATRLSGATDPEVQKIFRDSFLKARQERNQG